MPRAYESLNPALFPYANLILMSMLFASSAAVGEPNQCPHLTQPLIITSRLSCTNKPQGNNNTSMVTEFVAALVIVTSSIA